MNSASGDDPNTKGKAPDAPGGTGDGKDGDAGRTFFADDVGDRTFVDDGSGDDPPAEVDTDKTVVMPRRPRTQHDLSPDLPAADPPPAADIPNADQSSFKGLVPGTVLNNLYRVEKELSDGGMGRVFQGVEVTTGGKVAIKVILPHLLDNQTALDNFRAEASYLRHVHHDAIVRYFANLPPTPECPVYALVMDYVDGIPLSRRISSQGPMSARGTRRLARRLAEGLARAHELNVVHRDIAPDNVMLPGGEVERAVLIDFGISQEIQNEGDDGQGFSGKLKYASPEQMGLYGGATGPASDVYSLGLVLYTCLVGKAAQMGRNYEEAREMRTRVPDLSSVPFEFRPILNDMLQPDPSDRIKTMGALLERIGHGTTLTDSTSSASRSSQFKVDGLQAPSISMSLLTEPGDDAPPDDPTEIGSAPPPQPTRRSWLLPGLIGAVVIAATGALVAVNMDLLAMLRPDGTGSDTVAGVTRAEGTPDTYLATALAGADCAFATLRAEGPNNGRIEGYSTTPDSLLALSRSWPADLGPAPRIETAPVTDAQCAALRFARAFQGTVEPRVSLVFDTVRASGSAGLSGYVLDTADQSRNLWFGVITPDGALYSLTRQLKSLVAGKRAFNFGLNHAGAAAPYVFVAIATDEPLVRTSALQGGEPAADVLPLLENEILESGATGAVDLVRVEISP